MSADPHHGLGSARRAARVAEHLDAELVAGAPIRTSDHRRRERQADLIRAAILVTGLVLAAVVIAGAFVLSLAAVWHHLTRRSRQALVATRTGLHSVTASNRAAELDRSWSGRIAADIVLRPGQPEFDIRISNWAGRASGVDLAVIEATIRAAGGEPVRVVDR